MAVAATFASIALILTGVSVVTGLKVEPVGAMSAQVVTSPQPTTSGTSSVSTPTSTRRPRPASVQAPIAVMVPKRVIPASAPLHLSVPRVGIDGDISAYTQAEMDANSGGVEPPTLSAISWDVTIPGGQAGSNSTNTVYLYGHSWVEPAVFNNVKDMQPGDEAIVTTANGSLRYVAQQKLTVSKSDFSSNQELTKVVPGRLVITSCYRPVGYDPNSATVQNVVVILQLVEGQ